MNARRPGDVYGRHELLGRVLPGARAETAPPGKAVKVGVAALVITVWALAWAPQLLDLLYIGRQNVGFGEIARRSEPAATAYRLIIGCIGALSVALILNGLAAASARRNHVAPTLLLITPWAALYGTYIFDGGRNNEILLYPIVAIAFAFNWVCLETAYRTLRGLIVITAATSMVLGALQPSLFLSDPSRIGVNDKALVGDLLLNGLFPTSNQLGLALAFGIPLLIVTGRGKIRWASAGLVMFTMLWAASRTSIIVSLVVIAVLMLAQLGVRQGLSISRSAAVVAACLVFAVPFIFTDPGSFTNRARIWQAGLYFTFDQTVTLLFGSGAMVFRQPSPVTYAIGAPAGTGHNVFVTMITIGGFLAIAGLVLLWSSYLASAVKLFEADHFPLIFLLTLTSLSAIEDPLRAFIVGPQAFVIVPLLAMPLAAAYGGSRNPSHVSLDVPAASIPRGR